MDGACAALFGAVRGCPRRVGGLQGDAGYPARPMAVLAAPEQLSTETRSVPFMGQSGSPHFFCQRH